MTGQQPLPDLPAKSRRRAKTRCANPACNRPVYTDRLIFGLGRCCAENRGYLIRRWRLTANPHPEAPTLFDIPKDIMEPFPQIRVDVTGLAPDAAHTAIVNQLAGVAAVNPILAEAVPDVVDASQDHFAGMGRILERHAPYRDDTGVYCTHEWHRMIAWPCADYRDTAAGLAAGLPTGAVG